MESVYWAPAVMDREDRLLRAAFPDRAGIWFSGMNWLTHRISNGSNLSLIPLALSGLVRHVRGIPTIHWPTFFHTLGSPIELWVERYGDFSRPVTIPGKNSKDPVVAASAEWINFYDPDDVLAFPLKGLSEDYDAAVDEDRAVSVGALVIGMSPVSHVAYWNDAAVIRPIAQSLAWLWNALRDTAPPAPEKTA